MSFAGSTLLFGNEAPTRGTRVITPFSITYDANGPEIENLRTVPRLGSDTPVAWRFDFNAASLTIETLSFETIGSGKAFDGFIIQDTSSTLAPVHSFRIRTDENGMRLPSNRVQIAENEIILNFNYRTSFSAGERVTIDFGFRYDGSEVGNLLQGGRGGDLLNGFGGNDFIEGRLGEDVAFGGSGNDTIFGGFGLDTLWGGQGNDVLEGEQDSDVLLGQEDNDELRGGDGDDTIFGGSGLDFVSGDAGNDRIDGEQGDDFLLGGDGNDNLTGGDGDDLVGGESGNDSVFGWNGNDNVYGGGGNDLLNGDDGNDTVFGEDGDDIVQGGAGSDVVGGNAGRDQLFGGPGSDRFKFFSANDSRPGEADSIRDFFGGNAQFQGDVIDLSDIDANVTQAGDQGFSFVGVQNGPTGIGTLQVGILAGVGVFLFGYTNADNDADVIIDVGLAGFSMNSGNFIL
jgi:Ca2+-binding RTX toxin-like protein